MIHASYSRLREIDCLWTSGKSQITPAVLRMNIYTNPGISQSLFVISALVHRHFQVHPKFSPALRHVPKLITITPMVLLYQSSEIEVTPVPVIRDPSYSEGRPECPPRVWYSPDIDASKFTLHILSDTPGVFQRLKYILLMEVKINKMEDQKWTIRILLIYIDSSLKVEEEEWGKIVLIDVDPQAAEVQIPQACHNKEQMTIFRKSVLVIRTWKLRAHNLMRQSNEGERDDDWLNCLLYRAREDRHTYKERNHLNH